MSKIKSNYKYSDEKLEEYLGQLKSIELNDYYKSHGCKGEFTPVYLVRSCPKNLHLKDKYRSIIDSVLQSTQEPAKGIIKGISTGDKSCISKSERDLLSQAGIEHILAVSGFDVGLISILPLMFLKSSCRILRLFSLFGLIGIWGFIVACGAPNSAIRAGIMISVVVLAVLFGRRPIPFNSLFLAIWVLYFVPILSFSNWNSTEHNCNWSHFSNFVSQWKCND